MAIRELLTTDDIAGSRGPGALAIDRIDRPWRDGATSGSVRAAVEKLGRRLTGRMARALAGSGAASDEDADGVLSPDRVDLSRESGRPLGHALRGAPDHAVRSATAVAGDASERLPGHVPGRERLEAMDACIRMAATGVRESVGYATFTNETSATATVVALDTPAFERVEMRAPSAGERSATRRIDALDILAGDSVAFASGGPWLRLSGARQALRDGQLVGITVTFSSGRRRVLPFRIIASAAERSLPDRRARG